MAPQDGIGKTKTWPDINVMAIMYAYVGAKHTRVQRVCSLYLLQIPRPLNSIDAIPSVGCEIINQLATEGQYCQCVHTCSTCSGTYTRRVVDWNRHNHCKIWDIEMRLL